MADPIRLILHHVGEPFDDIHLTHDEWDKFKYETPYWRLPVLEVDGTLIGGTITIMRYLGTIFELIPTSYLANAKMDGLVETMEELACKEPRPNWHNKYELAKDIKALSQKLPEKFRFPINLLEQTTSGFLIGDHVTWADFYLLNVWIQTKALLNTEFDSIFPIQAHFQKMMTLPAVRSYYEDISKDLPFCPLMFDSDDEDSDELTDSNSIRS